MTCRDHAQIDLARCTGCGRCVAACRDRLITLEVAGFRKHALALPPERCRRCGGCVAACPVRGIALPDAGGEPPDVD